MPYESVLFFFLFSFLLLDKSKSHRYCGLFLFGIAPKRNQKSLENSIGLRKDYSSSANFLPPRAGKKYQQGSAEFTKIWLSMSFTCCYENCVLKNERPRFRTAYRFGNLWTFLALRDKKDKRKVVMMIAFRLALQNQLAA